MTAPQEPIDATFVEITDEASAERPHTPPSPLSYRPHIRQTGRSTFAILAERETSGAIPWGFIGGVVLALAGIGVFVRSGQAAPMGLWDILMVLAVAGLGLIMFRWGPRDTLAVRPLATLDAERQQLTWANSAAQSRDDAAHVALGFEEITEVVFAMISFPVSPAKPDALIRVYSVLVRDTRDELLPVLEATSDERAAYEIAHVLGRTVGLEVTQVGEGVLGR
ncbi:MAG: hypothetical protein AAGI01_05375 [Myxococcota bacterium]